MTTRRAAMRAYGEYLDFAMWLKNAKDGVDVEDGDPSPGEIAQMVKGAEEQAHEKMQQYLGYDETEQPE